MKGKHTVAIPQIVLWPQLLAPSLERGHYKPRQCANLKQGHNKPRLVFAKFSFPQLVVAVTVLLTKFKDK